MNLARVMCVSLVFACSGCAAFQERGELHWQTMHAIDTLQTLSLTRDSRYKEVQSAWLIGEHPKREAVYAWSVGLALAHAGVTQLLIEAELPRISKAWQYVTLSTVCHTVDQNASIGVRIGESNAGPDARMPSFQQWSRARALLGP